MLYVPPTLTGVAVLIVGAGPTTLPFGSGTPCPLAPTAVHVPQGVTLQIGMLSASADW